MQQVLHDNAEHIHNHGIVACSCGQHVWGCHCELCAASPPVQNVKYVDDACAICLERKRAKMFGDVFEVSVTDLSYRQHEEMGQELRIDALTAQISASQIRKLYRKVERADIANDCLLTVFLARRDRDRMADDIELGDKPDGDVDMRLGVCATCGQDKMLVGVYCVSCALDAYHEATPASGNAQV